MTRTTVFLHMFNEEYLLPFWLTHHKDMFDHGIIVDYRSTDNSVQICKDLCPTWDVVTTRNDCFGAAVVDHEMMDLESKVEGVKMILNVTEFLFGPTSVKDVCAWSSPTALAVKSITPYSMNPYNVTSYAELIQSLLNPDITYVIDRSPRYVHNYQHGSYLLGRHETHHPTTPSHTMHIVWLGFFPWNERLLKRKLQIRQHQPQCDLQIGAGSQHSFDATRMIAEIVAKTKQGVPLQTLNGALYALLHQEIKRF
jgi:hypothetical protein